MDSLRRFDVYPKTHDDLKVRTVGGALISVCCYLFAGVLFVSEFRQYRSLETVDRCVAICLTPALPGAPVLP